MPTGIARKTQSIFGSQLNPASRLAVWGSLSAGAPQYSGDPVVLQSLPQFLAGFDGEVVANKSPSQEDLNGIFYVITWQLAYLLERGIPEWDSGTTYFTNDICRIGGTEYQSQSDGNKNNNPAIDSGANWLNRFAVARGPGLCLAWAVFDGINATGGNARLINAFNVSTVTKNAAGSYTLNFTNPLPSQNYAIWGSCGSEDSEPFGAGDYGVVVGNFPGQGNAVRNTLACRAFTMNPSTLALVQPGCASVGIFGT